MKCRHTIHPISLLLIFACVVAAGCSKSESNGDGPTAATGPATQVDPVPPAAPLDLDALPTVEEAEQAARDQINEENIDEALKQLEAELGGGSPGE